MANLLEQHIRDHFNDPIVSFPPTLLSSLPLDGFPEITGISCASLQCHNGKKPNQDRLLVYYEEVTNSLLIAVFDGHGTYGHSVASHIRGRFMLAFARLPVIDPSKRIERCLEAAEDSLLHGTTINTRMSGCTAHISCFTRCPSTSSVLLHSVNVGDSEGVLAWYENDQICYRDLNICHNPDNPEEKQRIELSGGYVATKQIHPAVQAVPRVYANAEYTKGGLAMSRSLGDSNIHKYGVISTPTCILHNLSLQKGDLLVLVGSDGLMAYLPKVMTLKHLLPTGDEQLTQRLQCACEHAKQYTLESTDGVYSDDTSGIAIMLKV